VVFIIRNGYYTENFDNIGISDIGTSDIDYYVITMKNEERLQNIKVQLDKINENCDDSNKIRITQVDAVVGADLDLKSLVDSHILAPDFFELSKHRKNEVGCALSHMKIYNMIRDSGNTNGYSVIFEDDFEIVTPDFSKVVGDSLAISKNEDFDMLLLGNNQISYANGSYPKNKGVHIKDNVYHFNPNIIFFGTHAILINNSNISKIIDGLQYITEPIDQQIYKCGCEKKIQILTLYPCIVEQLGDIESTVQ